MTTDKQPREMLTIKELSELFGISRQAMRKHVDNLETIYTAKNSHGYKTVLWSGVLQLADKLGHPELLQETTPHQERPDIPSDLSLTTELLTQLKQKDIQIEQLQALLAQRARAFPGRSRTRSRPEYCPPPGGTGAPDSSFRRTDRSRALNDTNGV